LDRRVATPHLTERRPALDFIARGQWAHGADAAHHLPSKPRGSALGVTQRAGLLRAGRQGSTRGACGLRSIAEGDEQREAMQVRAVQIAERSALQVCLAMRGEWGVGRDADAVSDVWLSGCGARRSGVYPRRPDGGEPRPKLDNLLE
jgi:hypothetical protein